MERPRIPSHSLSGAMKPARTNPVRLFSGLRSYRSPRNAQFSKHMLRSSSPLGLLRNISQSSLRFLQEALNKINSLVVSSYTITSTPDKFATYPRHRRARDSSPLWRWWSPRAPCDRDIPPWRRRPRAIRVFRYNPPERGRTRVSSVSITLLDGYRSALITAAVTGPSRSSRREADHVNSP